MVHSDAKLLGIDQFMIEYGDGDRYELIDGELIEMKPTTQTTNNYNFYFGIGQIP